MARLRTSAVERSADLITWRDAEGRLVRCSPPPDRAHAELSRDELVEWAERWSVPVAAALRWYEQPERPPALVKVRTATILGCPPRIMGAV